MSRIKTRFDALKVKNEKALISYVTAGDPHPKHTVSIMHALEDPGHTNNATANSSMHTRLL